LTKIWTCKVVRSKVWPTSNFHNFIKTWPIFKRNVILILVWLLHSFCIQILLILQTELKSPVTDNLSKGTYTGQSYVRSKLYEDLPVLTLPVSSSLQQLPPVYIWVYMCMCLVFTSYMCVCKCGGSVYVASGIIMPGACCVACRFPHAEFQPQFQLQLQLQLQLPVRPAMSSCYQRSVPSGPTTRLRHATHIDFERQTESETHRERERESMSDRDEETDWDRWKILVFTTCWVLSECQLNIKTDTNIQFIKQENVLIVECGKLVTFHDCSPYILANLCL